MFDQSSRLSYPSDLRRRRGRLRRAFGLGKSSEFNPFLLLVDFANQSPEIS